jgi:hypothetical protein
MKPTMSLTIAALAASTAIAAPAHGTVPPVDVSPVKVSIGRIEPSPGAVSYRTYVRGRDGRIWTRSLAGTGAPTGGWSPLPGTVSTGPDVVPYANRQTHLLAARSTRGTLVLRDVRGGVATPWLDLGGSLTSAPSLALYADDTTIAAVVRGTDGGVWVRIRRGGVWQRWLNLGGKLSSAPDVTGLGGVDQFVISGRGRNGQIWYRTMMVWGAPAAPWAETQFATTSAVGTSSIGGGIPSAVGPVFVFRGADNALYYGARGAPVDPYHLGGQLTSGPDRDSPGGSKSLQGDGGEFTRMIVARDATNALALYDLIAGTWSSLGGVAT